MTVQVLRINTHAPVLQVSEPGPKTVFVRAMPNWPRPAPPTLPSISEDIMLEVVQTYGSISVTDRVMLPSVGWSASFLCDALTVEAHYVPWQGLVVPYDQYTIEAGYVPDEIIGGVSSYTRRLLDTAIYPVYFPVIGGGTPDEVISAIPNFTSEFRVHTTGAGTLRLSEWLLPALPPSDQYMDEYDFDEVANWTPLPALAYVWQAIVWSKNDRDYGGYVTVEFR